MEWAAGLERGSGKTETSPVLASELPQRFH